MATGEAQYDILPHSTQVKRVASVNMFESIPSNCQEILHIRFLFSSNHVQEFCRHELRYQLASRLQVLSQ